MEHLHTFLILLFLFCSPWLSAGTTFLTHHGTQCEEDCKPDGGEYKCKTIDEDGQSQALYCSPQENMDYWGRQCRADSACGKHGEDFYWCRINDFTWGYCGLVKDKEKITETGEVTHITPRHRNKRDRVVIDTVDDKANRIKLTFYAEEAKITEAKKWSEEATDLINQWNGGRLSKRQKSNLITTDNLRIDMQGTFTHNKQLYYNLQIQINRKRKGPNDSTTVSQILVPDGIPDEYMRRAFQESFNTQKKITVEVSKYQSKTVI
ncbi:uncharacterized protein LOC125263357 [Megalobrama amblycephala]|uniref:uncharacterized protein LOC125263357 n=1 Tax=Megalobrama amblycephala TaxID=75352 RepID=UPI002013E6BC|nr:uncharacterized protein LOC125263357 [Megalobrama amblycephala]XP_048038328.1 uncharacterized protein LOC125263357 [Megalobrama amblycephala]